MDKHIIAVKYIRRCMILFVMILLSACSHVDKFTHIEVFVIETSEENEEGYFEKNGYKKVNAITTTEEGKNHIKTEIKTIEDLYDIDGNYIKTEIIHSQGYKSNISITDGGFQRKEELHEPSTILIPDDDFEHFKLKNMSEDEMETVKEHVQSFMDLLK